MDFYGKEKALTVKQVAEYLQVNDGTIYKLAQAGKIPCFKVAVTWRFWKRNIDEWSQNGSVKKK
ncbi:MAG: helix-turn-helix domain-containing protein [Candidatus Firestonebacteria bacterium]